MTSKYFIEKFDKYNSYVIPAYRPKTQDSGRAKGGLAQLSLKKVDVKKDRVGTKNWRVQAPVLNFPTSRLLWINTYLPTDPHTVNFDESELLDVLNEIEDIMDENDFNDVILNGDLNWEMTRNTGFSTVMASFVQRLGLVSLWQHHSIDFTHIHTDDVSTATLDHFLVNERLLPLVKECVVLHRGDNLSRHSPILLKLDVGAIPTSQKTSSWLPRKPAWFKATMVDMENYKTDMQDRLQRMVVPDSLTCSDPLCRDESHTADRDNLVLDILCSVVESSHTTLPLSGGRRATPAGSKSGKRSNGNIPGWSEEVEPFRQEAIFWHSIWKSAGRPNNGDLYRWKNHTKNQYHYAVRKSKKQGNLTRANKLVKLQLVVM